MAIGERSLRWFAPRSWSRGDRVAIGALLAIPLIVYVLPAMFGHPAIVGDNLIQNYPLRVLTGQQLRAGHWPLWNPYSNSGTPLLGGMNAGSVYPGTLVFAVVPPLIAWVANLVVVYWCAGLGLYALARWLGIGPVGAGVGAAAYAFSGAMIGQQIHIAVIQGQSWLPWLVLAQLSLARALLGTTGAEHVGDTLRRSAPGTLGIAFCIGMICLTGEPRSIADAEIVVPVVLGCELVVHGGVALATLRGRLAYAAVTVLATGWGVALSLVQLLPGWGFVTLSERSQISYQFFGAGSIDWRWLSLLLSQGLLGDNGILGTPRFFGSYNLPEVTGYVGLLAVTAVAAFCAQLARRRSPAPRRVLACFLALVVVGLVLTMGNTTPVGPILHAIPLFGRTRLQSRNLAIVDLGATVLLGWWLDAVARRAPDEASLLGRRRLVTAAPAAFTALLCAIALVAPGFVTETLLAARGSSAIASGIRTTVAVSLVLAVLTVVLVAMSRRHLVAAARWLVVLALVDLLGFNVFFETGLVTGLKSPFPDGALAARVLGRAGRTALVDPILVAYHDTAPIGLGNLNVFTRLPSVQGYGSLISERYNAVTGTRLLGTLDGCALAKGNFVPLRLAAMAVAANALVTSTTEPSAPPGCGAQGAPRVVRRYFGRLHHVDSIGFTFVRGHAGPHARVVLLDAHGRVLAAPQHESPGGPALVVGFPTHPLAAGVELLDAQQRVLSTFLRSPGRLLIQLNTSMQIGLDQPAWRLVDVVGQLSFFRVASIVPSVWLTGGPRDGSVRVVTRSNTGTLTVRVTAARATSVVRSEAWLPGWVASVATGGAHARKVAVSPAGLIQSVAVPAGVSTVTFSYHAPHLRAGIVASSAATLALLLSATWLVVVTRRRAPR